MFSVESANPSSNDHICSDTPPMRAQPGLRAAGSSVVEILAQRRSAIFLLRQAAPLQLGHDQIDELADVVHGMKSAAQDEAAVGAGLVMQLLEHIDDRFRRAGRDQDPPCHEVMP